MSKILDWIKKHVWQTVMIGFGLFFLPLILVHVSYRIPAISPWFASTWATGELITYIAGFEAFIGTMFLGLIAVRQNNKINEINKRMLDNEEKRDLFERQPVSIISNCSCDIVAELDLHKKEPCRESMIYVQNRQYSAIPNDKFNSKIVFISFDITNCSKYPITFGLRQIRMQNIKKRDEPLFELGFSLSNCSNTSSRLLPNQTQNIILMGRDDTFPQKEMFLMFFSFSFKNLIGEGFNEESVFLLTDVKGDSARLSYLGKKE